MRMNHAVMIALVMAAIHPWASHAQSAAPTSLIVPFPAGGTLDVLARIVSQRLAEQTRGTFIVDNRPGANGSIGAKAAARAKPDGKTWLVADGPAVTINPFLYPADPSFSADKDLRPVRALAYQPLVLVVRKGFPATNFKEFVAQGQRKEVAYASAGVGSSGHLTMSLVSNVVGGLKLNHIPYKGGPQVTNALVAGEVDAGFIILPNVLQFIKRGDLLPLAVSSAKRSPYLPEVPTMAELGYNSFEVENRYFVWLPAATPDEIARKVDASVLAAISDPAVEERIRAAGLDPTTSMGESEARQWLGSNRAMWQRLIRDNNIKAE